MFCNKGILRNFTKFPWKHLCQRLFFNSIWRPMACNFIEKSLAQVFSCEFCEISKDTFFYRTPLVTVLEPRNVCFKNSNKEALNKLKKNWDRKTKQYKNNPLKKNFLNLFKSCFMTIYVFGNLHLINMPTQNWSHVNCWKWRHIMIKIFMKFFCRFNLQK